MKTSELKNIIKECGFDFEYLGEEIFIKNNSSCFGMVNTENNTAYIEENLPLTIAKALLDYAYTPLEEREAENKYYLRVPFHDYIYLNFYKCSYIFAGKIQEASYQTKFTQKEIDAMPFDTNFFIKEEVK